MKVLVIGQGGREHAIVHSLKLSPVVTEIHVLPGSDGIAKNALCHKIDWKNFEAVLNLCLQTEIDVVVIGPEEPLVKGLGNFLRERGVLVVGPNQEAARLEGSKIFAKEFMAAAKIPTAAYCCVNSVAETLTAATKFTPPYVLKADGLAAGKGVFICQTVEDLAHSANSIFMQKTLGSAGEQAILEQFSPGWELSYLVITNGIDFQTLPMAQDHKRLSDNDEGPNTGGMGTIAPMQISDSLKSEIEQKIVMPTIAEIKKRGFIYRGIIFFGLMITENGPSLLEYNCRFGDPETQVLLPLVENDLGILFKDLAQGNLQKLKFKNLFATCVVMAAPGYPDHPEKNVAITGNILSETDSNYLLHAGTQQNEKGEWVTHGGRVLNAIGLGSSYQESMKNAYALSNQVTWKGRLMRRDIGNKVTRIPT